MFKELSPTNDSNLVKSLMNLIECLTDEYQSPENRVAPDEKLITKLEVELD